MEHQGSPGWGIARLGNRRRQGPETLVSIWHGGPRLAILLFLD